jgi:hypothetical protein
MQRFHVFRQSEFWTVTTDDSSRPLIVTSDKPAAVRFAQALARAFDATVVLHDESDSAQTGMSLIEESKNASTSARSSRAANS